MKILFLSSGVHCPATRFRILPYVRHFRADGHKCVVANSFPQKYDYFPWLGFRPSQLLKRAVRWMHWLYAKVFRFDIVYVEREIFDSPSSTAESRFRKVSSRFVLDIDDAIFLRYPEKFDRLVQMSDLIVCGNRFLIEKVFPANTHTLHVPTCVDTDDYGPRPQTSRAVPIVGWIGTTGNLMYIKVAAAALRTVAREIEFEFRVVVPDATPLKDIDLTGVNVVHQVWDPENEVHQIQEFDIGLMPLFPNQEWDIYKCGLKLIQYLSVGVPGIAAPVGVNSEIIDENRNGFVAQSTEEWTTALRMLLGDESLRRRMGSRGRKTVEERYSIRANYPVLRDALIDLVRKPMSEK